MKIKKNFLKKVAAVTLGFVMTLGVGAAGYAASSASVEATSKTTTISTVSDTSFTKDEFTVTFSKNGSETTPAANASRVRCYVLSSTTSAGNGTKISVSTESTTKSITNISIAGSNVSSKSNIYFSFSGATSTSSTAGTWPHSASFSSVKSVDIYGLNSTSKAGQGDVSSITITYDETGSSKTLTSISVTSSNHRSFYTGDTFVGESVTATFSEGNPSDVTSDVEYSGYNMETAGTQTVTASYTYGGDTKSATYQITITAKPTFSYTLVTNVSSLSVGDQILIVGHNANSTSYYALAPYTSGNNCRATSISAPVNNVITTSASSITLGMTDEDDWTLFDGTYYLYAAGASSNNYLKGQANCDSYTSNWSIEIDGDNNAEIVTVADITRDTLMFNAGNNPPIFSCYSSGQSPVQIYALSNKYTVSFDNNGGSGSAASVKGDKGSAVTLPTTGFNKTGHQFDGWNTYQNKDAENAAFTNSYTGSADITLYAHYTPNPYTISYELDGVDSSNTSTSTKYGASYSTTLSIPTGYQAPVVEVDMGEEEITDEVYNESTYEIKIENVTGNITIIAYSEEASTFSVTYPSGDVSHTGNVTEISAGRSFETVLSVATYHSLSNVKVMMGSNDITSTNYEYNATLGTGTVSISSVSGDIVITADSTFLGDFTVDTTSISEYTGAEKIYRTITQVSNFDDSVIFTWTSDNPSVVSVTEVDVSSNDGVSKAEIQINGAGTATISIEALDELDNYLQKTISVTVQESSSTLSVDKTELLIDPNGSNTITPTISDVVGHQTTNVTVTYSNTYFTVNDSNGVVTSGSAVPSGTQLTVNAGATSDKTGSNITFSANGQSVYCLVKVYSDPYAKLTKVSSVSSIDGNEYKYVFYLSRLAASERRFAKNAVSSSKMPITYDDFENIFEFELVEYENSGTFYIKSGDYYLNNTSSGSLSLTNSATSRWSLVDDNGSVYLKCTTNSDRHLGVQNAETSGSTENYLKTYTSTSSNPPAYLYSAPANYLDHISVDVSAQSSSFVAGDTFNTTGVSVTASYAVSGSRTVTNNIKYYFGDSETPLDPENYPTLTKADDGKTIRVEYTDKVAKTDTYNISVAYKDVTDIELNKNTLSIPLEDTSGNPGSETLTATVSDEYADPSVTWTIESGSAYIELIDVSNSLNKKTVKAIAGGTAVVRVTSANPSIYDECEVTVTTEPVVSLNITEITNKSSGSTPVVLTSTISNFGDEVTYQWSAYPEDVISFSSTNESSTSVSFLKGTSTDTTITLLVTDNGGKSKSATCTVGPITQSAVTSFSIASSVPDGNIYLGSSSHNELTLTPSITTTGVATNEINWSVNDSSKVDLDSFKTSGTAITVTAKASGDAVITASPSFDSSKAQTFTVHVLNDSATSLSWTGRGNTEVWKDDVLSSAIDITKWSFSSTMASGEPVTPTFGTGADNVQIGLYDTKNPSTPTENPLSSDYQFTMNDNGKYLVAYYKGSFTAAGTNKQLTVKNWRSVTVGDSYTGTVNCTNKSFSYSIQDEELTLSASTSGNTYWDDNNSIRVGKSSGKGSVTVTANKVITSITITVKNWGDVNDPIMVESINAGNIATSFESKTIDVSGLNQSSIKLETRVNTSRFFIASIVVVCSETEEIGKTQKCLDAVGFIDEHLNNASETYEQKRDAFNALSADAKAVFVDNAAFETEDTALKSLVSDHTELLDKVGGQYLIHINCTTGTSLVMGYDSPTEVTSVKIRFSITVKRADLPMSDNLKCGFYYGKGSKAIDMNYGKEDAMKSYLTDLGMNHVGEYSVDVGDIGNGLVRFSFNINIPLTNLANLTSDLTVAFYYTDGTNMFIGEKVVINAKGVAQAKLSAGGLSELEESLYTAVTKM